MKHLFVKPILFVAAVVILSACEFSKCCGVVTRKEFVPARSKIVAMPAYKTIIPRRVSYPARWVVWVGKQPLTVSKTLYESLCIGDSVYYYLNGQIIRTSHLEP